MHTLSVKVPAESKSSSCSFIVIGSTEKDDRDKTVVHPVYTSSVSSNVKAVSFDGKGSSRRTGEILKENGDVLSCEVSFVQNWVDNYETLVFGVHIENAKDYVCVIGETVAKITGASSGGSIEMQGIGFSFDARYERYHGWVFDPTGVGDARYECYDVGSRTAESIITDGTEVLLVGHESRIDGISTGGNHLELEEFKRIEGI